LRRDSGRRFGQKIIERREISNLPILAGSHLTKVMTELDEAEIFLLFHVPIAALSAPLTSRDEN
jgi:hypothetical protein